MTVHLIKLCVGATSIEDLAAWQDGLVAEHVSRGVAARIFHTTLQTPKRKAELLDGGSLYWVMKGVVQARQALVGFDEGQKEDGSACCLLLLDREIVPVRPQPRRAFQGWRYLAPEDAPVDLGGSHAGQLAAMPARMRRDLAELGLI